MPGRCSHLVGFCLAWMAAWCGLACVGRATAAPPNIVVILADDLGFSDLGCYGGEIDTPHLDRLAAGGLRFTQGYNTARCWPTRAALLTGYYAQAINRDALPEGKGDTGGQRPSWARLLPELLSTAGYRSYHSGKWHIDGDPRQQGFVRSLQVEGGQNDYFDPDGVTVDGTLIKAGADYYVTTAIGEHAVECLRDHAAEKAGVPFFSFVAFTAPHFPLHAPQNVLEKYKDRYRAGWDALRTARSERLESEGIVTAVLAPLELEVGPPHQPKPDVLARFGPGEIDRPLPWADLTAAQREFQATKMAIHAAMVELMDRAVGRIIGQLEAMNALDDTLILFLSDNGASAELLIRGKGHDPALPLGSAGTFPCLGPGWSSCANTPFRRHKTWVHEGGIATPWIVHWPTGIAATPGLLTQPVHVIDVVPTVLQLAGIAPPREHAGMAVPPMQGRSFAACLTEPAAPPAHETLWWCHEGNRAVRVGDWKLVAAKGDPWELYELTEDRCETTNLANREPARVTQLEQTWERIAADCRRLAGTGSAVGGAAAARRPNIIYVMTDDQGYGDIAAHGNPVLATPNLDGMHRESVRFTECHASPTCAPTRAALLTGLHEFHSGVTHTIFERDRLALSAVTLPQLLRRGGGYATGIFGKWHLGDEDEYQPGRRGFDRVFIHGGGGIGQSYPGSCGDAPDNSYFDPVIRSDGTFVKTKGYCTDVFCDAALNWIDGRRTTDAPFFCYLTPNAPHDPLVVFTTDNGTANGAAVFNDGMRGHKVSPYRGGTRVPAFWRWPGRLPAGVDVPAVAEKHDLAAAQPDVVKRLAATYAAWWQSVQPDLVNEQVKGPAENPFRAAHEKQFGPRPTLTDVPYGDHPKQKLHFWKSPHAELGKPTPLLFFIHGGGWQGGNRMSGLTAILAPVLQAGISVTSIEYRFIHEAMQQGIEPPVKAPLADAARALQTVRSKAAEWGIDKKRIVAAGGSAGACSSLWLAFHDDMADPTSVDPVARESTRLLAAAVTGAQTTLDPAQMKAWTPNSRYGGHAFGFMKSPDQRDNQFAQFLAAREKILPWIEAYSPYALVTPDDPPVALFYATPPALGRDEKDPTHTANFGVKLEERLDAAGVPCELVYPGAAGVQHATLQDAIIGFLKPAAESSQREPARRPNIVFFLCDDLGSGDLACTGSRDIQTPAIDALFARGTRLSRHWAGNAVCAPSRCVLLTGKHPGHAVIRSNRELQPEGQVPMPAGTVTLAKLLDDTGYATGGFGKWGLGAPGSDSDPIACGFDSFFGYNCQRQAHTYYPGHLWNGRSRVPLDGTQYAADLIAERQIAFIKANAGRPFFLYVPTTVPHLALQVPADEPSLADYERHFGAEAPYLGGKGYVPCSRPLATYAAMITRMDREVGRIVKELDDLGLTDDTIFVFSSDNGATVPGLGGIDTVRLASNGPLRDWKGSPYEGGLRVPTVAVWPGQIPAGKVIDAPTGFEDWLPTLLDLAGLHGQIPADIDGVSLAPVLLGKGPPPRERVLYRELTERQWQTALDAHGRWKAVRKAIGTTRPDQAAPTELYDLAADPGETTNVAAGHPDVVARMEAILASEHVPHRDWPLPFADRPAPQQHERRKSAVSPTAAPAR
ncbi:MAG: sulfatase-like hydrolase/transferase [Pirellulales bacterium]